VKLLVDEPDSDDASGLWSGARLTVSSRLLYPEARAALASAARAGRVSYRKVPALRERLEALAGDLAYVEVTPALAARAGDLAEEHRLRGYDAVHLSSLLELAATEPVLVTGDSRLAHAALVLGVTTARLSAQSSAG